MRLNGRILALARAIWVALAALTLGLDIFAIPFAYTLAGTPCEGPQCHPMQPSTEHLRSLGTAGFSTELWALHTVAVSTVAAFVYAIIGILIFWRRSDDRMALFGSLMLVLFGGAAFSGTMQALPAFDPRWEPLVRGLGVLGQITFYAFFGLFPNGRFAPRWVRWAVLAWATVWLASVFPPLEPLVQLVLDGPLFSAFILVLLAAQVYRYRRVSNPDERRQTKWVVFGFSVALAGLITVVVVTNTFLIALWSDGLGTLASATAIYAFLLIIPISIGIAILRSQLYDIDIIINRALVYGSLTGTLALLYWGSVLGLQSLFRPLFGPGNDLAIVISTLAIAALFLPLRHRLQSFIDRRFYRRKYDATKTLAAFSQTARNEVDLNRLTGRLVEVVEETVQPAHVSLWLREPDARRRTG